MNWIAVAVGGALGAMARYGLGVWLVPAAGKFPVATFAANVSGCFLMGIVYVLVVDKALLPAAWRPFFMVGVLGAFTTFSTFAIEALALWQTAHHWVALAYVMASVILSIMAVWAGYSLCENLLNSY